MSGKSTLKSPAYISRLKTALDEQLRKLDIAPTAITVEHVSGTKLYRFRIIAPKFSKLRHIERQDLVWRLVKNELGEDEQLHVSNITTLTPSEAKDVA